MGNIFALLCVNVFTLSFVILSKYQYVNKIAVTAFAGISSALISFILVKNFSLDMYTLIILLIAGMLVSPMAKVLIAMGTKNIPASEVSLLMIIEAVMAPIWVWIAFNEIPAKATFLGGSIILLTLLGNSIYILKFQKK